MAKHEPFRDWLRVLTEGQATRAIKADCHVLESRREMDRYLDVAGRWAAMLLRYERETGRIAEER